MLNHQVRITDRTELMCGRCRRRWWIETDDFLGRTQWMCPHCEYMTRLEPMPPLPTGENDHA